MLKTNKYYLILGGVLAALIGFLFRESFSGMVLQGLDDNISMRTVIVRSLISGQGYHFIPNYWLGFIFNVPNPDLYNSILALTGDVRVVGVYAIALMLSGFVTYALIKRQGVSPSAAVFGALSYTFLPHVLSLVYSGHALALEAIPMTPAFLLCLDIMLDDKTESKSAKILAVFWAGIFWAWMMIGEPQRGVYGTTLAAAWVLFLMIKNHDVDIKNPKALFARKSLFKILSLLGVVAVGLGIFLSTIKFWANSEFLSNQGSWEFATSWSFPPKELIDSFAYGYHGLSSSDPDFPYIGDKPMSGNTDSLGFFLMVFMLIGVFLCIKNTVVRFFAAAGLIALLLSFGKYFPPLFWLWYHIPGMDRMRVPAKFLSITGLSWSIVAAFGLDAFKNVFTSDNQKTKQNLILVLTVATSLCVLWAVVLNVTGGDAAGIREILSRGQRAPRDMVDAALLGQKVAVMDMCVLFALLTGLSALMYFKDAPIKYFPAAVIVLAAMNLYNSNRFYIAKTYVDIAAEYPRTELIEFLQENLGSEYRASGSLFIPNLTHCLETVHTEPDFGRTGGSEIFCKAEKGEVPALRGLYV